MILTSKKSTAAVLAVTLAMSLSACSNWSKRDRNTAIGAGAGAWYGGACGGAAGIVRAIEYVGHNQRGQYANDDQYHHQFDQGKTSGQAAAQGDYCHRREVYQQSVCVSMTVFFT